MPSEIESVRSHLGELGARIAAKREEFQREGVLHGEARKGTAEPQIQLANAHRKAKRSVDELNADVEILNRTFERWLARLDKKSEHVREV